MWNLIATASPMPLLRWAIIIAVVLFGALAHAQSDPPSGGPIYPSPETEQGVLEGQPQPSNVDEGESSVDSVRVRESLGVTWLWEAGYRHFSASRKSSVDQVHLAAVGIIPLNRWKYGLIGAYEQPAVLTYGGRGSFAQSESGPQLVRSSSLIATLALSWPSTIEPPRLPPSYIRSYPIPNLPWYPTIQAELGLTYFDHFTLGGTSSVVSGDLVPSWGVLARAGFVIANPFIHYVQHETRQTPIRDLSVGVTVFLFGPPLVLLPPFSVGWREVSHGSHHTAWWFVGTEIGF